MFPAGFRNRFVALCVAVSLSLLGSYALAQNEPAKAADSSATPVQSENQAQPDATAAAQSDASASKDTPPDADAPQDQPKAKKKKGDKEEDPLKRPLSDDQKKKNAKGLKIELSKTYKKWLDEDVRWIITDEERAAFKQLSNDEERDNFIEQFWLRRDPTPDTAENEYKEEHYRRIAYANEHFAAGVPGWRTDRGRIYIMYGKADEIDAHPSGG